VTIFYHFLDCFIYEDLTWIYRSILCVEIVKDVLAVEGGRVIALC
jgi:hypothetical protein